jgi:hypothetical protein
LDTSIIIVAPPLAIAFIVSIFLVAAHVEHVERGDLAEMILGFLEHVTDQRDSVILISGTSIIIVAPPFAISFMVSVLRVIAHVEDVERGTCRLFLFFHFSFHHRLMSDFVRMRMQKKNHIFGPSGALREAGHSAARK